jgi:hypothetical protein
MGSVNKNYPLIWRVAPQRGKKEEEEQKKNELRAIILS